MDMQMTLKLLLLNERVKGRTSNTTRYSGRDSLVRYNNRWGFQRQRVHCQECISRHSRNLIEASMVMYWCPSRKRTVRTQLRMSMPKRAGTLIMI